MSTVRKMALAASKEKLRNHPCLFEMIEASIFLAEGAQGLKFVLTTCLELYAVCRGLKPANTADAMFTDRNLQRTLMNIMIMHGYDGFEFSSFPESTSVYFYDKRLKSRIEAHGPGQWNGTGGDLGFGRLMGYCEPLTDLADTKLVLNIWAVVGWDYPRRLQLRSECTTGNYGVIMQFMSIFERYNLILGDAFFIEMTITDERDSLDRIAEMDDVIDALEAEVKG